MTDLLAHMRRSAIPYVALLLVLVVGLGGGYALAASKTKTITVCADKGTGILHLKTPGEVQARADARHVESVGPQGPGGVPGPAGQQGASAVSVWANVTNAGSVFRRSRASRSSTLAGHVRGHDHRPSVRSKIQRSGD